MTVSNQIPIAAPTLNMEESRIRQIYSGFSAKQIRIILQSLDIEPPARLPSRGKVWVCLFPNIKALLLGCTKVSVSKMAERVANKPLYQLEVERFATPPIESIAAVAEGEIHQAQ